MPFPSEKIAKMQEKRAGQTPAGFCVLGGDASLFAGLTFPRFRALLRALPETMLAVGAVRHGRPCGLALGLLTGGRGVTLLSVAVAVSERRLGVGLSLLRAFEVEALHRGADDLCARYQEGLKGRAAFEALSAAAGWGPPEEDGLVVVGRAGAMAKAVGGWPSVASRLARSGLYSFTPVVLSEEDRQAAARYMCQPETADMNGPLALPPRFAPACSVLIRRAGVLVGWVLAEEAQERFSLPGGPQDQSAICYSEAFLDPACWHSGVSIAAYHHCYAAQARLFGPRSLAVYYTNQTRPRMVALTRRRFAPLAERVEGLFTVRRHLPCSPQTEF